jgi:ATPase subunit of ABC transporter with duplicated ATPase domains
MSRLLIQCTHAFKSFGIRSLFQGITLSVNQGEKFALIGENGCGKTTLLKILAGLQAFDDGKIQRAKYLTIGILPQEIIIIDPEISVRDYILDSLLKELKYKMAHLENHLDDPICLAEWGELHEEYERKGGYQILPVEEILYHLKIDLAPDLRLSSLSCGQRMRAALAKILINNPDIILLDEPTNHLDHEMIQWLQKMLSDRKGAAIVISHDRKFLNQTCNKLIEIQNGHLASFGGNYDFYLEEREKRLQNQIKAFELQQEELKILKEKLRSILYSRRAHKSSTDNNKLAYNQRGEGHQKSIQRSIENLKSKIEEIEKKPLHHPRPKSITGIHFSVTPLDSNVAIAFESVGKSYENKAVLSNFNKILHKGERVVITGPNGSGKTTILAAAAGYLSIDEGYIQKAPSAKVAYLDQEVMMLSMEQTPLEYFNDCFNLLEEDLVKELYKAGLGDFDLINRPFKTLSTGQRKRLMILSLILSNPNVLLLDEPTNHLDFLTLEALEKALLSFEGAILAVSHDSTFIEKIATNIWSIG